MPSFTYFLLSLHYCVHYDCQVYENLITKCSEMIPEQLEQKGLHVDFLAASKEEQAEEMFRILDALNNK